MPNDLESKMNAVADLIVQSKKTVVFTGAGVSTESGIPDFRSPGGIWSRFDPDDFTIHKFIASRDTRKKQWRILVEEGLFQDLTPNDAHRAIADMERLGMLDCVITQNIDDLHQRAGNSRDTVFELHGNMRWVRCLDCGSQYPMEEIKALLHGGADEPSCRECRGMLKPDVVFFGEALPADTIDEAVRRARACDLMIVVGSSLVVQPAAFIPAYAQEAGASLIIINIGDTPYDRRADIRIHESAGKTMDAIVGKAAKALPRRRS
jgi:NAD-dependent deacetylase